MNGNRMLNRKRQAAWNTGYTAAMHGSPPAACREQPGTIFFDDWNDGHDEGTRDRERPARVQP
jgi:hypothetical protein